MKICRERGTNQKCARAGLFGAKEAYERSHNASTGPHETARDP